MNEQAKKKLGNLANVIKVIPKLKGIKIGEAKLHYKDAPKKSGFTEIVLTFESPKDLRRFARGAK